VENGYGLSVAADGNDVWVDNIATGFVTRIDPSTNTIVATIAVAPGCDQCGGNLSIGEGAVWVDTNSANFVGSLVRRIDPRTNTVVATIDTSSPGRTSTSVIATPGGVWVPDYFAGLVRRIDPRTNKLAFVTALETEPGPTGMSYGAGSLWLCNYHGDPGLLRLDPTTLQLQAYVDVSQGRGLGCVTAIALDQAVWVLAKGPEGAPLLIERVDTTTNQVSAAVTPPGSGDVWLAADAHGVWYLDSQLGLLRLDPQSCKPVAQLAMADGTALALGDGSVWVTSQTGILSRITPST
jgi:streptogramin lyase